MTPEMKSFLLALLNNGGSCERSKLPFASRSQDRARQKCRKDGLAVWKGKWFLTTAGRDFLIAEHMFDMESKVS